MTAVGQSYDLDLRGIFLRLRHVGVRWSVMLGRLDLHLVVSRKRPFTGRLKERLQTISHELLILLPVLGRDDRAGGNEIFRSTRGPSVRRKTREKYSRGGKPH